MSNTSKSPMKAALIGLIAAGLVAFAFSALADDTSMSDKKDHEKSTMQPAAQPRLAKKPGAVDAAQPANPDPSGAVARPQKRDSSAMDKPEGSEGTEKSASQSSMMKQRSAMQGHGQSSNDQQSSASARSSSSWNTSQEPNEQCGGCSSCDKKPCHSCDSCNK